MVKVRAVRDAKSEYQAATKMVASSFSFAQRWQCDGGDGAPRLHLSFSPAGRLRIAQRFNAGTEVTGVISPARTEEDFSPDSLSQNLISFFAWSGNTAEVIRTLTRRYPTGCDIVLLVMLSSIVLLCALGQNHHWSSREIRHAEIMREMAEGGDFVIPRLMGDIYVDKPPVMHALGAAFMRFSGSVNLWWARLPSALAGMVAVLCVYVLGRKLLDRSVALLAATTVLAFPGFISMARVARPDMALVTFILLSCVGMAAAMGKVANYSRAVLLLLAGLAAGLAVVTKGPYGLIFPLFFLIFVPMRHRQLARPGWLPLMGFACAVIAVLAAWVAIVWQRDGGKYFYEVIHQPDLSGTDHNVRGIFWYIAPFLLQTLPLSAFTPLAVGKWRREGFSPSLAIALAILLVVSFFPKKRNHYLLPLHPFLALAIADGIIYYGQSNRVWRRAATVLIGLVVVASPLYYGVVLPRLNSTRNSEPRFVAEALARVPPSARLACDSGMEDEFAWVRRDHRRITTIGNEQDAVNVLRDSDPDTYLVLREPMVARLTNAPASFVLETVLARTVDRKGIRCLVRKRE